MVGNGSRHLLSKIISKIKIKKENIIIEYVYSFVVNELYLNVGRGLLGCIKS